LRDDRVMMARPSWISDHRQSEDLAAARAGGSRDFEDYR